MATDYRNLTLAEISTGLIGEVEVSRFIENFEVDGVKYSTITITTYDAGDHKFLIEDQSSFS